MPSENKKRKLKNSHQYKTYLKDKLTGIKGMTFYTSSERQRLKAELSSTEKEIVMEGL